MTEASDIYSIPSSYSRIVARELGLQERGLPRLLQGTGLSTEILLPGDETLLTSEQQLLVLENGRRMGNIPEFGLRVGRQLQPSAHGPLGFLTLSSPDLVTALKQAEAYGLLGDGTTAMDSGNPAMMRSTTSSSMSMRLR